MFYFLSSKQVILSVKLSLMETKGAATIVQYRLI